MDFKRVTSSENLDADAIVVTLFLCKLNKVRGWIVGPISSFRAGFAVPYVPPSKRMPALMAMVCAKKLAMEKCIPVCVLDPDHLLDLMIK